MGSQTLITGATGFIGRQLTRDLVAKGERVRVLARDQRKASRLFGDDVEICPGDVTDAESVERACRGIETVYHIAGIYRFGMRHRHALWEANVQGTENMLRGAAEAKVERVVHLSSGGVLDKNGGESGLIDENDFPAHAPSLSFYKASKWHAEKRVMEWVRRGLPVRIASTTCPIGGGDEAPTPTGRMIRDFVQRRFPFYCRTGLNFIDIGDLSQGLQLVAASGRMGERYLLADENLWLKDFLGLLSHETGLPAPRHCIPDPLIHVIGCFGEVFNLLDPRGESARACLETATQAGRVQFFSNARARSELGWRPATPLRASITKAVAWFRNSAEVVLAPAASPSV